MPNDIEALKARLREVVSEEVISTAANHDIHAAADALDQQSARIQELEGALRKIEGRDSHIASDARSGRVVVLGEYAKIARSALGRNAG